MKKFVNDASMIVEEGLAGFAAAHQELVVLGDDAKFVRRARSTPGKVALL